MSVEDTVQTSVPFLSDAGIQPSNSGTGTSLCFNLSKAGYYEKLTDFVLTPNAFPGKPCRESVQGLVRTCLEMCVVDLTEVDSLASTVVAADLGWNLETTPQRDRCSKDLRSARPKVLIASPSCALFLTSLNHDDGSSIPLESGRGKSSSHDLISWVLCANAVHRYIVVTISFLNIHRTRHH